MRSGEEVSVSADYSKDAILYIFTGGVVSEISDAALGGDNIFGMQAAENLLVVNKYSAKKVLFYQMNK